MLRKLLILICICNFTAEYDYYETQTNIVGGTPVKISELPFIANLGIKDQGKFLYLCGGTLINRWIHSWFYFLGLKILQW